MKEERIRRVSRIRKSLFARGLDAALITGPENRFYLSGFLAEDLGFTESAGALLISKDRKILLTDGRYETQAREQSPDFDVVVYKKGLGPALKRLFKDLGVEKCAYEPSFVSCSRLERLKKVALNVTWHHLGSIFEKMREIKAPGEYEMLKQAQKAAESVFQQVYQDIRPGMTEKEIAFMILKGLYLEADGPSFPPIVASGPNSALPHAVPGDRKIQKGEAIIIDMGARLNGYCSDMTRTLFLGAPSRQFMQIYNTVKQAQAKAQEAISPGMTGMEADGIARKVIKEAGYGPYFVHSLGHGVGIAIHEAPGISPRSRGKLRPGMVFTVEPGIYIPGQGGVRLENMGILDKNGLKIMTSEKWFYDF